MGKASSPVKKAPGALNSKAAPNVPREVVGARSFDDSLVLDGRVERVESTIVNRETATHLAFAKSRKDDFAFAPSPHYVQILNNYCHWDRDASHSSILVVVGQPGNGKSAMLAHWVEERRRSEEGAEELIYEHYSGCSYDSVKLSLFLFRFMAQIRTTYMLRDFELPREHEEEKLKFSFGRCLEAAVGRTNHISGTNSKLKRIILVLDGIDCIRNEDGGDSLSWLPTSFPANVRIIVSATQTTVRGKNHLRCCKWTIRKPIAYEEKYSRTIDGDEKEQIVTSPGSSSPLYVRLLLHALELFEPTHNEARKHWLKTATQTNELHVIYELLMKQWNKVLLSDLNDSYHRYKAMFDAANNNDMHGAFAGMIPPDPAELENLQTAIEQRALLVRHTLSLLAVSRYGLTDADFAKLFGDSVPKHVCQQMLKLLRPHVIQIRRHDCKLGAGNNNATNTSLQTTNSSSGNNNNSSSNNHDVVLLNDLSHNQLRLITRYGFLRDDHLRSCYYRELANYFEAMDACQRRVDELPVQLERCAAWSSLQNALVDIKMFQLWWSERNRQEFFSYWMVLRNNCSIHDPVDDFIRSLDEYVARENPSADQLLALFLTITDFLRAWQKIDDSKGGHLVVNRPEPPQLQEFITSLGSFTIAHLSESEAKKTQQEIDALCIHADDGYYVRRWLWAQFPLIGIAFETRFLRNVLASRFPGTTEGANAANEDSQQQQAYMTLSASSTSLSSNPGNNNSTQPHTSDAQSISKGHSFNPQKGTILPKSIASMDKSKSSPIAKRKPLPVKTLLPTNSSNGCSSPFDAIPEDDFGAFEFLSPENSEISIASVSKLETHLMDLRMKYDKLKFAAKEKNGNLKTLESRLLDTKAQAKATGQSASKMDDLLEQIRQVNDDAVVGRQRSDYYKSILRHCEVNPARDPNTIENAETIVNKLKQEVIGLQQKAQVISYEKRLASIEVPKLLQVIQDKSKTHQTALARLRFRQELNHRVHSNLIANKLSTFAGSSNQALHDDGSRNHVDAFHAQSSPAKNPMMRFADAVGGETSNTADLRSSELISGGSGRRATPVEDTSFLRAKDKLLHKKEATAERQKKAEYLKMYVGSAYKDDGILGALRQVGINKPEDAQVYWQDQLDHAAQLEGEEKAGEQRVTETRELLATLQAQFVNLKLGGCSLGNELAANGCTASGTGTGTSSTIGLASGASDEGGGTSKSHNIKVLEQQLAETVTSNQQKKERSARLKLLSEKLHLGLLHVAQIVGVASAQQMDSLALGDSIEQVVRLFLGDESHLQSSSSTNLRRKNSARVMGLANQAGSHPFLPPNTRTASDKIRYNVRVLKHQTRSMNPYVGDGGKPDDNDDEESESDNDAYDSALPTTGGLVDGVKKRQDIKNQSKMELHKKEAEKKRAEKKRKA
uniref:Nephrocystin 3-like N-terminal domain-containing protein n=1 Tax=Globisporangium ultimum (strain ATCC 200006 / CBS 805.95 / DAOM BR144) TaxID=431595 RepID=K3WX63_GLOUD